jgi:hypothetical protein
MSFPIAVGIEEVVETFKLAQILNHRMSKLRGYSEERDGL